MTVTCFELLDRHVIGGHADHEALHAGATRWSYARLLEEVSAFGGVLGYCGVQPGERIAVVLPESPERVVALLACARIGAEHAAAASGGGKVLVTASTEQDALRDATAAAVLVKQRPGSAYELREGRDHDWDVVMRAGRTEPAACLEGATVIPWNEPTRALLGPLLEGGTIRLPG